MNTSDLKQVLDSIDKEQFYEEIFTFNEDYPILTQYDDPVYANIIDKEITGLSEHKSVSGEALSQYIEFRMPRQRDGVDINTKQIKVLYEIEPGIGGVDIPINVAYSDRTIKFGWVIPARAVIKAGIILVGIAAIGTEDEKRYIWKTIPAKYQIDNGIDMHNNAPDPDPGWYDKLLEEINKRIKELIESSIPPFSTHEQAREGNDDASIMTPVKVLTSIKSNVEGLTNIEIENICR